MTKQRIIEDLGEVDLLAPALIARALAANERVKYLLALLQNARAAADGEIAPADLREERLSSGVDDPALDRTVAGSVRAADCTYRVPGAAALVTRAFDEVDTMLAALRSAGRARALDERLARVGSTVAPAGDRVTRADITKLTDGRRGRGDTLHLIVMDAHRELNELAATMAPEAVDGARAYGLGDGDRALVRAFMAGVRETERLRFDHPGLGTLAIRAGDALTLQNDIGTTDAHVVVVRLTGHTATITYTDVHLERLLFFQHLLEDWDVRWEDTRSRHDEEVEDGLFHLAVGRLESADEDELARFLRTLGSELVFMIDWNRARKRLRSLVGKRAAVQLLEWAAREHVGHMAFLLAGGDRLVYEALEFAGGRSTRPGGTLSEALGAEAAAEYLQVVLRVCAEGLLAGRSLPLIRDEVRAELIGYLRTARDQLLELAVRHGELVVEIAEAARDALLELNAAGSAAAMPPAKASARAGELERMADAVVNDVRLVIEPTDESQSLLALVESGDDAADGLEDATYYLTLLDHGGPAPAIADRLRTMCELVLAAARSHLRALLLAADVQRDGRRDDLDAFLEAAHRVVELERAADDAERAVHAEIVRAGCGAAELFVLVSATAGFEAAADALMHSSLVLRAQVLGRARADAGARRRVPRRPRPSPGRDAPVLDADRVYVIGDRDRPVPDPSVIGNKAHGLARMVAAGMRVPEASVLTTAVSREHRRTGDVRDLGEVLRGALGPLEGATGLRLGSSRAPLLVSVRSGAPVSMPGMLATVLNVGVTRATVGALIATTGNPRLVWDSYRRLIESYAQVVAGCPEAPFEAAVAERLRVAGADRVLDLEAAEVQALTMGHLERFEALTGAPFPDDSAVQLERAVRAVLTSWDADKAVAYRRHGGLSDDLGTAVIIQRMVFGNAGGLSGSGVGFTRDPALGDRALYLDFVMDGQGEDVVSGRHGADGAQVLARLAPELHAEIAAIGPALEREFGDAQEFELTIEDGVLFLLQTRAAMRTPWAALRIAVDQVRDGLITPEEGLRRLDGLDLAAIERRRVDREQAAEPLARAIPAGVGVASGPIALDAEAAERLAREGAAPVLVRRETITDDVSALLSAAGILTAVGGRTSHAAVVARELGRPCLVGCADLSIDLEARTVTLGTRMLAEGDTITLDAESGMVLAGEARIVVERPEAELAEVASWQ